MPRLLRYVSGVRLIADPYDLRLWHFAIRGKRYDLHARGGTFVLKEEGGTPLGRYSDWTDAVAYAREHAHTANTERMPTIPPRIAAVARR
ncbi:MAG: hypothetical protein M3Y58_18240 [Chloroflexota bacterium]|nr:hypothetical protein [Chloroflexota bacterium]